MNMIGEDEGVKLFCCEEAFKAMLGKGETPGFKETQLSIDAMMGARLAISEMAAKIDVLRFRLEAMHTQLRSHGIEPVVPL